MEHTKKKNMISPSLLTTIVPTTPLCDAIRFNVSSTSCDYEKRRGIRRKEFQLPTSSRVFLTKLNKQEALDNFSENSSEIIKKITIFYSICIEYSC